MKLSSAAIGLAAVGAGLMVARLMARKVGPFATIESPSPDQLIGQSQSGLSAESAAEVFRSEPERPH